MTTDLGRLATPPGPSPSGQAPAGLAGSAATIPSAKPWWFSRDDDQEHLWGGRPTREEAIDAGIAEYDGEPFYVCQGGHFRNQTDIFDIEWVADRFDDANDEYAGEENASEAWTDAQANELISELNATLTAWAVRHGHDKAYAIDAGFPEPIDAQAIEARRAATGTGAVHESADPQGCAKDMSHD